MNIMPCRIRNFNETIAAFKATGVLLLRLIDGVIFPLEHEYGGDPEIFPIVPLFMKWFQISLDQAIWWTYATITLAGLVIAVAGFLRLAKDWISRVVAVCGVTGITVLCYEIYDVYLLSFFALCFVPWLFVFLNEHRKLSLFLYCVLAGFVTTGINFLRLHTGTALGLVVVSTLVLYYQWSRKMLVLLLCFCTGVGVMQWGIQKSLEVRNAYLDTKGVAHGASRVAHTFWHNVYAGLGFLQNEHGIYYGDQCSTDKVQELAPHVVYLSDDYEGVLRAEILRLFKTHPQFIMKTLAAKAGVLLYYLLLFANVGLLCAWFYRKPWYLEIPYWLAIVFSALPGMVTVPVAPYLTGFFTAATFYGVHSILWALQHGLYQRLCSFFKKVA